MAEKEKMKGVVAQLVERTLDGKSIGSKIVFRPYCDWYIKPLHDYLAETEFTDFEEFQKEVGLDVAERVVNGEIVEVTRDPHEDLELRSCHRVQKFIRVNYPSRLGSTEDLMNETTAKKLGYMGGGE